MNCTKCGRDTEENTVFCQRCLETMSKYPVKPGAVIQLPQRKPASSKKSGSRKRQLTAEEQLLCQRRTIRWLWVALVSTLLLLSLSVALLFHMNQEQTSTETIGQNYMTRNASPR